MSAKYPLPPGMEPFVRELVASGRYEGEWEVIGDALELLKDREAARTARLHGVKAKIDEALNEVKSGGGMPAGEVFAQLRDRIKAPDLRQLKKHVAAE